MTVDILDIAARGGLIPKGRGAMAPCPVCGATQRGREDRRGPLAVFRNGDGDGWRCHASGCSAGGDAAALLAALRFHEVPAKGDRRWADVFRELDPAVTHPAGPRRPHPRILPVTTPHDPHYPPTDEVTLLWNACHRLDADTPDSEPARRALELRGLDSGRVGLLDLARALPLSHPWPTWLPRAAPTLYQIVVPVHDASGTLRSLRFRAIRDPGKAPKALPPRGFDLGGLVMADSVALALLRGARMDEDGMPWDGRVLVAEGETDWWTLAAHPARLQRALDAGRTHAVFGIVAGSWTPQIAARIPSGAAVVVWTDLDPAGDRYAETIRASLSPRCDVRRRQTVLPRRETT